MCLNAVHGALHLASLSAGRASAFQPMSVATNATDGAFTGLRVLIAGRGDVCLTAARGFEVAGATVAVVSECNTDAMRRQKDGGTQTYSAELATAAESLGGVDVLLLGDRMSVEAAPDVAAAVRQHVLSTCNIIKAVQGRLQESEGCIIDCAGPASMGLDSGAGPCPSRVADEVQAVVAQGLGDWLAPRGIRISLVGHAGRGAAIGYSPQALTRQIMFLASEGAGACSAACRPPTRAKAGYLGCGSGVQHRANASRGAAVAPTAEGGKS